MRKIITTIFALAALTACGAEEKKSDAVEQTIFQCEVNLKDCIGAATNEGETQENDCQQEFNICTSTVVSEQRD